MVDALNAADLLIGFGLDPVEIDKTWHAELDIQWVLEARNATGAMPNDTHLVNHVPLLEELAGRPRAAHMGSAVRGVSEEAQRPAERHAPARPARCGRATSSARSPMRCRARRSSRPTSGRTSICSASTGRAVIRETFWMSNGLSGMAYGLSAAIGAKLARPDVPVLAAVGDGGFSMNAQELETAERVGAPFITVVLEDNSYSLIKLAQENRKLEPYRMDFNPIDNVKMAEACGVRGMRTAESR